MHKTIAPDTLKVSADYRVFLHHIYEYKKGVRAMVLCTIDQEEVAHAEAKLRRAAISYFTQATPNGNRTNIFFGHSECLNALRLFLTDKTLNNLSPEEDFIVGTMLGYDICRQCTRYCHRKNHSIASTHQSTSLG